MFRIEPATEQDVPVILRLVRSLAEYEQLAHAVVATEATLRESLFVKRAAEVVIGYAGDEPAGFAVFFQTFSTFLGLPGMYLEDLFVEPAYRRQGLGEALLAHLAKIAVERRVRTGGVVGARLERARDRLLPEARRTPDERLGHLPAHRRLAAPACSEVVRSLRSADTAGLKACMHYGYKSCTACRTASAWLSTFTLSQRFATFPSGPIRYVVRTMPMNWRP